MNKISVSKLSFTSIFKLLFVGLVIPFFLFGIGCGVAAFLGCNTVTLNGANVYGLEGLLTGLFLGLLLPAIFSILFTVLMSFGLWVYFRFSSLYLCYESSSEAVGE